jgi:hypothetical protein
MRFLSAAVLVVALVSLANGQEYRDVASSTGDGVTYRVPIERFAGVPPWAKKFTPMYHAASGRLVLYSKLEDGCELYVYPPAARPTGEVRDRPIGDTPVIPNGVIPEHHQAPSFDTNDPATAREIAPLLSQSPGDEASEGDCPNDPLYPDDEGRRQTEGVTVSPAALLGIGLVGLSVVSVLMVVVASKNKRGG